MGPVIEVLGLTKCHGRDRVLDHLDLRVEQGGIHALIGRNGAGKTTLFQVLLGFVEPTGGRAIVLGRESDRLTPADRARIGFVDDAHRLPSWVKAGWLADMSRRHYPRWNEATFSLALGDSAISSEQRIGDLSRGERAIFDLALTLAQSPDLLLLDEPTLGLDLVARRRFMEALLYSNAISASTIVYCSHHMDEVERLADNLIVMEGGRVRLIASPDELRSRVSRWISDIPFRGPPPAEIPGLLQAERIDGLHHHIVLEQDDGFAAFLRSRGARIVERTEVDLETAMNALLAGPEAGGSES